MVSFFFLLVDQSSLLPECPSGQLGGAVIPPRSVGRPLQRSVGRSGWCGNRTFERGDQAEGDCPTRRRADLGDACEEVGEARVVASAKRLRDEQELSSELAASGLLQPGCTACGRPARSSQTDLLSQRSPALLSRARSQQAECQAASEQEIVAEWGQTWPQSSQAIDLSSDVGTVSDDQGADEFDQQCLASADRHREEAILVWGIIQFVEKGAEPSARPLTGLPCPEGRLPHAGLLVNGQWRPVGQQQCSLSGDELASRGQERHEWRFCPQLHGIGWKKRSGCHDGEPDGAVGRICGPRVRRDHGQSPVGSREQWKDWGSQASNCDRHGVASSLVPVSVRERQAEQRRNDALARNGRSGRGE